MNPSLVAMSPQISDLPPEVIETIVCQLDRRDVGNLRLVSRSIEAAASQAHYKTYFIAKMIKLEPTAISKFAAVMQHSRLAGLLQNLKLIGTERLQEECFAPEDADTLLAAFRSLCHFHKKSNQYCLRSLTAGITRDTVTPQKDISHPASRSAAGAQAVRIALRVVNDSDLPIEKLHLLYNSLGCSVPCCVFEHLLRSVQPSPNWSRLRCLTLSLTHHAKLVTEAGPEDTDNETIERPPNESVEAGTRRVQALVDFFSLISNIEELSLRWSGRQLFSERQPPANIVEKHWFNQVSLAVKFPKLKQVELRGFHITKATLQRLLTTSSSLQHVHLEYIRLTGSLRPILDTLTSPNTAITYLYLDDIYEHRLVHFNIQGSPKFPYMGHVPGPSTVLREGDDVRLPLEYGFASDRPLGSPQATNLRNKRRVEFGYWW